MGSVIAILALLGYGFFLGGLPHDPAANMLDPSDTKDQGAVAAPPGTTCWVPQFADGVTQDQQIAATQTLGDRARLMGIWAAAQGDPLEIALSQTLDTELLNPGELVISEVLQSGATSDPAVPEGALIDARAGRWIIPGAPVAEDPVIAGAYTVGGPGEQKGIGFDLTPPAAAAFAALTTRLAAERGQIVIAMDGRVLFAPQIMSPISGGQGVISGHFTDQEALHIAVMFQTGPLAARVDALSGPVPCGDWIENSQN